MSLVPVRHQTLKRDFSNPAVSLMTKIIWIRV